MYYCGFQVICWLFLRESIGGYRPIKVTVILIFVILAALPLLVLLYVANHQGHWLQELEEEVRH